MRGILEQIRSYCRVRLLSGLLFAVVLYVGTSAPGLLNTANVWGHAPQAQCAPGISEPARRAALAWIEFAEGSGNGVINTYDGQLLSFGTLHHALKSGTLYPYLFHIWEIDPAGVTRIMGGEFTRALIEGRVPFTRYIEREVTPFPSRWRAQFRTLYALPAREAAEMIFAEGYFRSAIRKADAYGLRSERGIVWAFDRAVQQGGALRPRVTTAYRALPEGTPEWQVMRLLGQVYGETANPRWKEAVLNRTLTVALGGSHNSGRRTNGRSVHLEQDFGARYLVPWLVLSCSF